MIVYGYTLVHEISPAQVPPEKTVLTSINRHRFCALRIRRIEPHSEITVLQSFVPEVVPEHRETRDSISGFCRPWRHGRSRKSVLSGSRRRCHEFGFSTKLADLDSDLEWKRPRHQSSSEVGSVLQSQSLYRSGNQVRRPERLARIHSSCHQERR